ncbi:MAG: DAK2 domain-containing protein [Clostridia bacterium]|nr:DAK2 domain-containing protein [Clostridia bacterium]
METKRLTGELWARMVLGGAENLKTNADIVNDLNVFPIPDGDTGDNMGRTIKGGADRILHVSADAGIDRVASDISSGMLLAARGNSGVILSQFFEGISLGLIGKKYVNTSEFANAFQCGVEKAYSSVVKPTEGTILTVMREATEAGLKHADGDMCFEAFFDFFTEAMYESLDRTPELLPVLKEAGVIDSGGAGFVYIIEGMARALRGEQVSQSDMAVSSPHSGEPVSDSFNEDTPMEFGYCTEVMLQLRSDKEGAMGLEADRVSAFLSTVGDSVVVFRTGSRVKIHVHTFEPDKVLAWCRKYGEFVSVKIENMSIQHNESNVVNRFVRQTPPKPKVRIPVGVVAVAQGEGIKSIFTELGVDCIVDGQQTMNPSAEDFIKAFDTVNADKILVFPNNSNIVLAAKQAAELYSGSEVFIVPSLTVAECYAALTMMDLESGDMDTIMEDLKGAIDGVITGLVTWAVRDSVTNGFEVKKGDWLGFAGKELKCVAPDKAKAAAGLLDSIDMSGREIVIAICGDDVTEEDKDFLRSHVTEKYARTELYEVDGGQDIYSFILAVE